MKKAAYGARVNQVERASFTPLVFSTSGVAGKEVTIFLKLLAALVVDKKNKDLVYSAVKARDGWITHPGFVLPAAIGSHVL